MKKSRILFLTLTIALAILLSGCAGGAGVATSWPGLTVDPERGLAYLAYQQNVFGIDLETGQEAWRFPVEAENNVTFFAPPVLSPDGQLVAGSYNNVLYSLNPENGQVNWAFEGAGDRYIAGVVANDSGIYAPNADERLYALSLSGDAAWDFEAQEPLWGTPAKNNGILYLPAMDHSVYALDAETGDLVWRSPDLGGAMVGEPTLADGILYIGTFNSEMLALSEENGEVIWRTPTSGWVWDGPTLDDGVLYFGDLRGTLYALNAADGSIIWQVEPNQDGDFAVSDRPLVSDGMAYFTSEAGILYFVNTETGNVARSETLGGQLYTGAKAADELMLVPAVGADALLFALDGSGNRVWTFTPQR